MTLDEKFEALKKRLRELESVAVAFSGGVDSTFLLAVAREVLGDKVVAVNAVSPTYPAHEHDEARSLAEELGVPLEIVESNELEIPNFSENPVNRCYYCKSELFKVIRAVADRYGYKAVADGTNADDLNDHRPGRQAAQECGVASPLLEAGLSKDDIRALSREMGLATAEKPAFACLASRFPYGAEITEEKLAAVGKIEDVLRELGFGQFRVRHHGDIARIEVSADEIDRLMRGDCRAKVTKTVKDAGFLYVTVDLEGYRTGSMNEGLGQEE